MSITNNVLYPLDTTGQNPNNLIIDEEHNLLYGQPTPQYRIISPNYGPFYKDSLVVMDASTGNILDDTQYQVAELHRDATLNIGLPIYQIIVIKDPSISNTIKITYQVVGGNYQYPIPGIVNLYNTLLNDNRPVDWSNILNKPNTYPPSLHSHYLSDIYGFQSLVDALERVKNAINYSSTPLIQGLLDYIDTRLEKYPTETNVLSPDAYEIVQGNMLRCVFTSHSLYEEKIMYWNVNHITTTQDQFNVFNGHFTVKGNIGEIYVQTKDNVYLQDDTSFSVSVYMDNLHNDLLYTTQPITLLKL